MTRRKTREETLEDFERAHGDTYNYDKVVYVDNHTPVIITCKIHGDFPQTPASHKNGRGCPLCASSAAKTTEQFVAECLVANGSFYDYSEVNYINKRTKVKVICPLHGPFTALPKDVKNGSGCRDCSNLKISKARSGTQEDFLSQSFESHGGKYDYSETVYVADNQDVKIICPVHGVFYQNAGKHKRGCGCPKCKESGYRVNRPGNLYLLTYDNLTKVGITNRKVSKRVHEICKDSELPFTEVMRFNFANGYIPLAIETQIHKELRKYHSQPTDKFDGYTECFINVDIGKLITRIGQIAGETFNQIKE